MIQIVLADDNAAIRHKLKRLLGQETRWQVIGDLDNGLDVVGLLNKVRADVLVTDLGLPGLHGLEVVRRVHQHSPDTRIVVVSIHADEPYVRRALSHGALGYVRKDEVGHHLIPAIRAALAGDRYLSPALMEPPSAAVPVQPSSPTLDAFESLNQRERSALQLMAQGYTDAEIGLHLRLTVGLAGRLRYFLMQRLHLKNDEELTALARRRGLLG